MKQNRNTNTKRVPRVKVVPTVATQTFPSFEEAIANMRGTSTIIDSFFGEDITIDNNADDYAKFVAGRAAYEYPQLLGKHNIHTSYHIAANKVSVRGEHDLQFGWELKYTITDGKAVIDSVECTIIMYNKFDALKEALDSAGWDLVEKKTRPTV